MSLESLPFDVIFEILQLLTVRDLVRFEQTCTKLRDLVSERSIWAARESQCFTLFPSTSTSSLSTPTLRRNIIKEAVIESHWQKDLLIPAHPVKVYLRPEYQLHATEMLPGGQCILFVYSNGSIELAPVQVDYMGNLGASLFSPPEICNLDGMRLKISTYELSQSSQFEGHIVVELDHVEIWNPEHESFHVRIYSLNAHPSTLRVTLEASFSFEQETLFSSWRRYDNTFACFHIPLGDPNIYVSIHGLTGVKTEPPLKARFQLSFPTDKSIEDRVHAFAMISNSRFVVAGPSMSIFVFDTSVVTGSVDGNESPTHHLAPIWKLQSTVDNFLCSPVFYIRSAPLAPMLWITQGENSFHFFVFSQGKDVVEKHEFFDNHPFTPSPAVGFSRAMWAWGCEGSIKGTLLTLKDSWPQGSFEVALEEGDHDMDNYSFDEDSGRISILIRESSSRICALILDPVPEHLRW